MKRLAWPESTALTALAAFTTWITLFSWRGLAMRPSDFLLPLIVAGFLVGASGMALRATRLPRLVVPVGQLVVAGLWFDHHLAAGRALGGWVPTGSSIARVNDVVAGGIAASQRYAPPVPESATGVVAMFVLLGCGAFILVDLLAVTLRRVPLAGLPLLLLYTIPVTILDGGVSWWVFVLSAMSFCVLLATQEALRLGHWGRELGAQDTRSLDSLHTAVSGGSMRSSARRIGAFTTGVALVVPILVPTLSLDLFSGNGPGNGDGNKVSITNPIVNLRRDLVRGRDIDLLWVTTTERAPSYLRISVLDSFDGTSWRPSARQIPVGNRAHGRMPRPPGLDAEVPRTEVPYLVHIGPDFDSQWLPTPYPLSSISAPGDWRFDPSTSDFVSAAEGQGAAQATYSMTGLDVDVTAADLVNARPAPDELRVRYTRLPGDLPASVRSLANDLTRDATSKFDAAVRLQTWFRETGGFRYSLRQAAGNGNNDLVSFLSEKGRVGYCEQFAAAMAVLGRAVNIPSRVVVGFLHSQHVLGHQWVFSAHDLHAWPEMYFEGVGWVRFEPTPQDRAATVPSYTHQQGGVSAPTPSESSRAPQQPQGRFDRTQGPDAAAGGGNGHGGGPTIDALLPWAGGLALLILLLLVPRAARAMVDARRWRHDGSAGAIAAAAWADLRDHTRDLGSRWSDDLSPRSMAHVLATGFGAPDDERRTARATGVGVNPEADRALEQVTLFVERARYARSAPVTPESASRVRTDVSVCVAALTAGATTSRRRRATWWPGSITGRLSLRRGEHEHPLTPTTTGAIDHAV